MNLNALQIAKYLLMIHDKLKVIHWFYSQSVGIHNTLGNFVTSIHYNLDKIVEYLQNETMHIDGEVKETITIDSSTLSSVKQVLEQSTDALNVTRLYILFLGTLRNGFEDPTFRSLVDESIEGARNTAYQLKIEYRALMKIEPKQVAAAKAKKKVAKKTLVATDIAKVAQIVIKGLPKAVSKNIKVKVKKADKCAILTYEGANPEAVYNQIERLCNKTEAVASLEDIDSNEAEILLEL